MTELLEQGEAGPGAGLDQSKRQWESFMVLGVAQLVASKRGLEPFMVVLVQTARVRFATPRNIPLLLLPYCFLLDEILCGHKKFEI